MIQVLPTSKTTYSSDVWTWETAITTTHEIVSYKRDPNKIADAKELFKTDAEINAFEIMLSHNPEFLADPIYKVVETPGQQRVLRKEALELDYLSYRDLDNALDATKWFEFAEGVWKLVDIPKSELDRRIDEKRKEDVRAQIKVIEEGYSNPDSMISDHRALKFVDGEYTEEEYEPYKTARCAAREQIRKLKAQIGE